MTNLTVFNYLSEDVNKGVRPIKNTQLDWVGLFIYFPLS